MILRSNRSCRSLNTFGDTKAGGIGPTRIPLTSKASKLSSTATAFCSNHESTISSGRSFTPQSKAFDNASAT